MLKFIISLTWFYLNDFFFNLIIIIILLLLLFASKNENENEKIYEQSYSGFILNEKMFI